MTVYIMTWNPTQEQNKGVITRQEIIDFLDKQPEVINWRASVGAMLLVSDLEVFRLGEKIHGRFPYLHYLLAPINISSLAGFSEQDTWDFVSKPGPPQLKKS